MTTVTADNSPIQRSLRSVRDSLNTVPSLPRPENRRQRVGTFGL